MVISFDVDSKACVGDAVTDMIMCSGLGKRRSRYAAHVYGAILNTMDRCRRRPIAARSCIISAGGDVGTYPTLPRYQRPRRCMQSFPDTAELVEGFPPRLLVSELLTSENCFRATSDWTGTQQAWSEMQIDACVGKIAHAV